MHFLCYFGQPLEYDGTCPQELEHPSLWEPGVQYSVRPRELVHRRELGVQYTFAGTHAPSPAGTWGAVHVPRDSCTLPCGNVGCSIRTQVLVLPPLWELGCGVRPQELVHPPLWELGCCTPAVTAGQVSPDLPCCFYRRPPGTKGVEDLNCINRTRHNPPNYMPASFSIELICSGSL